MTSDRWMIRIISIVAIFLFLFTINGKAQYATSISGGEWNDNNYWGGSAPPYLNVANDVTINHRVYSNQSITFDGGGSTKDQLTINDTLIIYGDLQLGLDDDITVGASAVVIIFGDFSAVNKVSVANGGYFVVLGNFTMTGGANTDYNNTGDGKTFIVGTVDVSGVGGGGIPTLDCDPNVDVGCGYGDGSDLFEDPIFDFIREISDETCSITLTAIITDESTLGAEDGDINITLTGTTSPSFSWSNDEIAEDISGLAAADYSLVVFDGICVIDTTFTISSGCPGTLIASASVTTPIPCNGETGTVTLTASGGTNPIDYTFNGTTNATGIFAGVSAGTGYAWSVTDANGCGPVSGILDVSEPALPGGSLTCDDADNVICEGTSITFTAINGDSYDFMIDGGSVEVNTTGTYTNSFLTEGIYTISVEVTYNGSCTTTYNTIALSVDPVPDSGDMYREPNQ